MLRFPSPTGVNHYESSRNERMKEMKGLRFRPQQGLIIMNYGIMGYKNEIKSEFPSPTGVNHYEFNKVRFKRKGSLFPSPTGVNHYEYAKHNVNWYCYLSDMFPSPTGVNHYESVKFLKL